MRIELVLIDIQNDYFSGGKCELFCPEAAAVNAKRLLERFRMKALPVLHVQHINLQNDTAFFLPSSAGTDIHQSIRLRSGEAVIIKHTQDSFFRTALQNALEAEKIDRLLLCGMMSHMCIDTTVRTAKNLGYDITVACDACTTKALQWKEATISAETVHQTFMAALRGSFAAIQETDELLKKL